jgi:hypothetical protein
VKKNHIFLPEGTDVGDGVAAGRDGTWPVPLPKLAVTGGEGLDGGGGRLGKAAGRGGFGLSLFYSSQYKA